MPAGAATGSAESRIEGDSATVSETEIIVNKGGRSYGRLVPQGPGARPSPPGQVMDALHRGDLRLTDARSEVVGRLIGRQRPATANELHAELRRDGLCVGLTTVYGTLLPLAAKGVLHSFTDAGEAGYRLCGATPHHHALCTRCRVVEEFSAPEADRTIELATRRGGFLVALGCLDVHGLCASCARQEFQRSGGSSGSEHGGPGARGFGPGDVSTAR